MVPAPSMHWSRAVYGFLFYSSRGSPSEGHNPPRGSPRKFAPQGALQGLSEGSAGVSPRVLRGSAGFCGGPRDFPRVFGGSDPMLLTLGNCWRHNPRISQRF